MSKYYIEVKRGVVRWYYLIKHGNGQTLNVSQHYWSKSNALRAAHRLGKKLNMEVKVK